MPCTCCDPGRCCDGPTCTVTNKGWCLYNESSFTAGEDCAKSACIKLSGESACTVSDKCQCAYNGGITVNVASCNCNAITAAGYPSGGCQTQSCFQCNPSTGLCVYSCPWPRSCCLGTCCPEPQYCKAGVCSDLCAAGTTYCNTTVGGSYSYACCTAGQKCCGTSGCQNYTPSISGSALLSGDKSPGSDGWLDTGKDLVAGDILVVTATGTVNEGGGTATPNGKADDCNNANRFTTAFCFMALIGKVGGGGAFLVGSSYTGSPGAGRLYLRVNRGSYISGTSQGGEFSISYSATTDPCPGFTPASVGEPIVYPAADPPPGSGAALKEILGLFGIVASPTCSCNSRAKQMDAWGEWECLTRLPEIVGWLREEAGKRGMWFFPPAGAVLVLAAISLSALKRPFRGNSK